MMSEIIGLLSLGVIVLLSWKISLLEDKISDLEEKEEKSAPSESNDNLRWATPVLPLGGSIYFTRDLSENLADGSAKHYACGTYAFSGSGPVPKNCPIHGIVCPITNLW